MGKMTTRRKLAIATWRGPREGNIYGKLTVDMTQALAYIEQQRKTTGEKITITHLAGKAIAMALAQAPGLNGRILFGRYIPHKTVDITYLVVLEGGKDLAKVKVNQLDTKSVSDVARELRERAERLRDGKDDDFEKSKGLLRILPTWLLRPLINTIGFIGGGLGISLKFAGIERFPFGSCIITNVGVFGLDEGFAPHTPFARVPVLVLLGVVRDAVVPHEGEMAIRPMMTITATIDHRFMDGAQGGVLARVVRDILENPWQLDNTPDDAPTAALPAESSPPAPG